MFIFNNFGQVFVNYCKNSISNILLFNHVLQVDYWIAVNKLSKLICDVNNVGRGGGGGRIGRSNWPILR